MSITSFWFLLFIFAVILAYYLTPQRFRWVVLLVASISFYLLYSVKASIWLFITSVSIYAGGLLIKKVDNAYQERISALSKSEASSRHTAPEGPSRAAES